MSPVYCDPELPKDWEQREARLALERQHELALREPQLSEPDVLDLFRRWALI